MLKPQEKIRVGIVGASSISSGILMKILAHHKYARVSLLASESSSGEQVSAIHKFLAGVLDLKTVKYDAGRIIKECDVVFFTKPQGEFLNSADALIKKALKVKPGIKFIDLSADFRLKDISLYKEWYGIKHSHADLVKKAVYGLPEIYAQKIKNAFLVANPGCYATCAILSLAPLFAAKLVDKKGSVIVHALSGVSGAGRRPNARNLATEVEENIKPYKIGTHAHTPEIEQELGFLSKDKVRIIFAPHVAPFKYGMITSAYLKLRKKISIHGLLKKYREFYRDAPFVRIMKEGEYPEIQNIAGTNFCDIGIQFDKRTNTCVAMGCIDNLYKGAAGQAIENMNIMFGLDQAEGLPFSQALGKD